MNKQILIPLLVVALVAGAFLVFKGDGGQGSVQVGNSYNSTTTDSIAQGVYQIKDTINSSFCVLGSVVIASSSATSFEIRNATSTTDVSSTTIATFEADAGEGTYTFDTACTRGIGIVVPSGFNGVFTTTFR